MTVAVILVIGLPGAGKSTLCKQLQQSHALHRNLVRMSGKDPVTIRWISFDKIEKEDFGNVQDSEFDAIRWKTARAHVQQMVSELRESAPESTSLEVVLLDDNFYYNSMRKKFKPNGIIFVNRPVSECIASNQQDRESGSVPDSVIDRMALLFEIPLDTINCSLLTASGDPDIIVKEVVDAEDFWFLSIQSAVVSTIATSLDPIPPTSREIAINTCEINLRKCVSLIAQSKRISPESMREISKLKSQCLAAFKQNIARTTDVDFLEAVLDNFSQAIIRLA